MITKLAIMTVLMTAFTGCYRSHEGGSGSGSPVDNPDAQTSRPDVTQPIDAANPVDVRNVRMDGGRDVDDPSEWDASTLPDGGSFACSLEVPPPPDVPRCSQDTFDCLFVGCGDDLDCYRACLKVDGPECERCHDDAVLRCFAGQLPECFDLYANYFCCQEQSGCDTQTCVDIACLEEIEALGRICFVELSCDEVVSCFPEP